MAISFYPSENRYVGLSTDSLASIIQEGAKIYLVDTRKTQICHSGVWYDYNDSAMTTSTPPNTFTLQNNSSVTGIGTPYTTKGEKTITIETVGTNVVSSQINFEAQYSNGGSWYPIPGNLISNGVNPSKQTNTVGMNEVWQFDSTNVFAFRSNLISISGTKEAIQNTVNGTITTTGNATATVTASGMTGSPKAISVAVQAGVAQVETATVVGTVTTAGNATVIVTATGVTGFASPVTYNVAVALNDTATLVAGKIITALQADANLTNVTNGYTVGGTGATVTLTRKVNLANDTTLNINIANGTCAGLTAAPTSVHTTAGVAPDNATAVASKVVTALQADTTINGFFTISSSNAVITMTTKTAVANDTTMNLSVTNGTCAGLTLSNATITTAGTLATVTVNGIGTPTAASAQNVNASITGSLTNQITLQSNASAIGAGTPYTLQGEDSIAIEITGTATSSTIQFQIVPPSGTPRLIQGYRISDGNMTTQTTTLGEIWLFDGLKAMKGWQFQANLTAVSGGNNINVAGQAVA